DPRRQRRPLTWRRLTVAENLGIVPRDVATAYRIQVGHEQWLVYRSLAKTGNRSVLGHNTLASFACSRILASGETDEILAIEYPVRRRGRSLIRRHAGLRTMIGT